MTDGFAPPPLDDYVAGLRARIPGFIATHLGLVGSLRLHREALGLDLVRAPLNVLLVGPALALRLAGHLLVWLGWPGAGAWLLARNLFLETRLARRIAALAMAELLVFEELERLAPLADKAPRRRRIEAIITDYVSARHAVAELGAGLVALVVGILALQTITPSALSLGPTLAGQWARNEAIRDFWLGPWAGAWWHGWYPAQATWPETIATTLLAMAAFALVATFMGLVTDPLQTWLGLHQRRLSRLVDAFERLARGDASARLELPDPYLPRIADLADAVLIALRATR